MGTAFVVSIALNLVFVVVEGVFGVVANSTALLADAAHNLSDVMGLAMAFGATLLARRPPSARHTFGFRRSTILAALGNAILLVFAVGGVAWEAIARFNTPAVPEGPTMMAVAAVGIVVNTVSALLLRRGQKDDANVRGAFLHLVADALVSVGVVVAGAIVWQTGWQVVDPITSLVISVVVLWGTWSLLKDAVHLSMDGVPNNVDLAAVTAFLSRQPGVQSVHDVHVWAMSTAEVALTAHLVMPWCAEPPAFMAGLHEELEEHFGIAHSTVQIDPIEGMDCGRCDAATPQAADEPQHQPRSSSGFASHE